MNESIYTTVNKAFTYEEMASILEERKKAYTESINLITEALHAMQMTDHDKAYELLIKAELKGLQPLTHPEGKPVGRPRLKCSDDMTLDEIRNQMRDGVSSEAIAKTLGVSRATFWRRIKRSNYVPGHVNFSALTNCSY